MRFIHCSDIHLGRRPVGGIGDYSEKRYTDYFKAFEQVIDVAIKEDVDAVLIAGDLFDKRELSPEILHRTENILSKLVDKKIAAVCIEGNHDNISIKKESESWLVYLEKSGLLRRPFYEVTRDDATDTINYKFTPISVNGTDIYGLGYPGSLVDETVGAFNSFLIESGKSDVVALLHSAPANTDFLPGLVSHESIRELKGQVKYLGCGHFHSYNTFPKDDPILYIPGSTEYWDLGEIARGDKKGMILFDTESSNHQFIKTKTRNSIVIKIDSSRVESIYETFEQKYRDLSIVENEDIVILELKDSKGDAIDSDRLTEIADSIVKALKFSVKIKRSGDLSQSKEREAGETIASVEERIIETWELFGDYKSEVQKTLDRLKDGLGSGNRDLFNSSFDELLDTVIQGDN